MFQVGDVTLQKLWQTEKKMQDKMKGKNQFPVLLKEKQVALYTNATLNTCL